MRYSVATTMNCIYIANVSYSDCVSTSYLYSLHYKFSRIINGAYVALMHDRDLYNSNWYHVCIYIAIPHSPLDSTNIWMQQNSDSPQLSQPVEIVVKFFK